MRYAKDEKLARPLGQYVGRATMSVALAAGLMSVPSAAFAEGLTNQVAVSEVTASSLYTQVNSNESASEENISQLRVRLAIAKDTLKSAVVSEDGADVPFPEYWVPSETYAELEFVVQVAEELLLESNPSEDDVYHVSEALSLATLMFENAKTVGTEGVNDPASEENIEQLEDYLAAARETLASAAGSKDGSDILPSQFWVPSDVHDNLSAAVIAAADLLASENPTKGDVYAVSENLSSATNAFESAKQPGSLVEEYASAEELKQFEDAIKDARADLQQTAVSADGTDVAKGTSWVTQSRHDAFEAAIVNAENAIAVEMPLASDIERAASELALSRAAFDDGKADGLKAGESGSADEKSDATSGSKNDSALARTGDDATLGIVAAGVGGVAALVAGAAAAMRRRSDAE